MFSTAELFSESNLKMVEDICRLAWNLKTIDGDKDLAEQFRDVYRHEFEAHFENVKFSLSRRTKYNYLDGSAISGAYPTAIRFDFVVFRLPNIYAEFISEHGVSEDFLPRLDILSGSVNEHVSLPARFPAELASRVIPLDFGQRVPDRFHGKYIGYRLDDQQAFNFVRYSLDIYKSERDPNITRYYNTYFSNKDKKYIGGAAVYENDTCYLIGHARKTNSTKGVGYRLLGLRTEEVNGVSLLVGPVITMSRGKTTFARTVLIRVQDHLQHLTTSQKAKSGTNPVNEERHDILVDYLIDNKLPNTDIVREEIEANMEGIFGNFALFLKYVTNHSLGALSGSLQDCDQEYWEEAVYRWALANKLDPQKEIENLLMDYFGASSSRTERVT